jgi:hypothetical protein
MKKINFLFFILIISSLFISCATTIETVKSDSSFVLKKDEGFILMKIINPDAGKIIDEFYYSTGEAVKNQSPLHLNSDLQIKKAPGSFSVFTVENTENEQLVLLKAKKGLYGIIKVGENSEYFNPYAFKVEAGAVNYAGDVKLDIVKGRILVWHKIKDYYDLSILDNFDEILKQRESSDLLSSYSDFEFINQAKNVEPMKPLYCHVIRDN